MYSTNHQQDRGQQAPNVKPAPKGGHFILHIEDVATDNDKLGLAIYWDTVREPPMKRQLSASLRHSKR
jgi:hypothetical protein